MTYTFIVRNRAWLVGVEKRFPGDLIPEAAEWPNLRVYVDNKWIEKIPVDDPEVQAILERKESAQPKPSEPVVPKVDLAGLDNFTDALAKEGQRRLAQQQRSAAAQGR